VARHSATGATFGANNVKRYNETRTRQITIGGELSPDDAMTHRKNHLHLSWYKYRRAFPIHAATIEQHTRRLAAGQK